MSQRNSLAGDSAPLVCRDPLPFDTPHVLTGYLRVFHSLWCGLSHDPASSHGMEMSCQNFHYAEDVSIALEELNPCCVGLVGFGFCPLQEATAAFVPTAVPAGQSPAGGQYWGFHVQLPISRLKISLVFVGGGKSFNRAGYTPSVLLFPWQKSHLKALGHKTQQKLSMELNSMTPVSCSQLRVFNASLKYWVAHTFLCLLLLQAVRRCCA